MKWHHAGIQVHHFEKSIQFYEMMFDFKIEHTLTFPGEKIVFLIKEGIRIELIESEDVTQVTNNSIHLSWQVENVEEWIEKLSGKGLFPSEGPYKLENRWNIVFYEGLNNEIIELIQISKK